MENTENCCLAKILKVIDILQKECTPEYCKEGCDKPFLGSTSGCYIYNTRPITLYTRNGTLFEADYYIDNVRNTSSVFRVEDVDGCCAKLRILRETVTEEATNYTATNEFITVNLNCFCVLQCLTDTFIDI